MRALPLASAREWHLIARVMRQSGRATAILCLAWILAASSTAAVAGPTLLFNATSGEVLYADEPDQSWFPASLTKLMTAYITFETVKAGKLSLETKVPLSEKARGQPATKVGLKPGIELNVDQALRGLILRSANDFAMALAELIGGSEEGFADLMNATAKRLGMTRTRFKNPHGLPDPEQQTTARDMAILAIAVLKDFPERAEVFSTMQFVIHKGTFHNQNDLMRTLPGADGMKTGFACGAGYNVVASATRDGRRLIAVVLGQETRAERSQYATALLEHGFDTVAWKETLGVPQLASLAFDPPEAQPVYDMTKETRTRKCGNRVRVSRRPVAKSRSLKPAAEAAAGQAGRAVVAPAPASKPGGKTAAGG